MMWPDTNNDVEVISLVILATPLPCYPAAPPPAAPSPRRPLTLLLFSLSIILLTTTTATPTTTACYQGVGVSHYGFVLSYAYCTFPLT